MQEVYSLHLLIKNNSPNFSIGNHSSYYQFNLYITNFKEIWVNIIIFIYRLDLTNIGKTNQIMELLQSEFLEYLGFF